MTTKHKTNDTLDNFPLYYEDLPEKIHRVTTKKSKLEQQKEAKKKKVERVRRPRKPSAFKMFAAYWIEVVTA